VQRERRALGADPDDDHPRTVTVSPWR
jgi:hypothetical protein